MVGYRVSTSPWTAQANRARRQDARGSSEGARIRQHFLPHVTFSGLRPCPRLVTALETAPCKSTRPNQLRRPRGAKPGACTREKKERRHRLTGMAGGVRGDHVTFCGLGSCPRVVTTLRTTPCASPEIPPKSTRRYEIHTLRTHTHAHGRDTRPPPPMQDKARSRCTPQIATQHAHAQCRPSMQTCDQDKQRQTAKRPVIYTKFYIESHRSTQSTIL